MQSLVGSMNVPLGFLGAETLFVHLSAPIGKEQINKFSPKASQHDHDEVALNLIMSD